MNTLTTALVVARQASLIVQQISKTRFHSWETTKSQIGSLNSEATIATFLAAVQSQIIALSYQDNSTGIKVTANAFGFAGVLLDVITACLALLVSTILQRDITDVEKNLKAIEDCSLPSLRSSMHRGSLQQLITEILDFDLRAILIRTILSRLQHLEQQYINRDGHQNEAKVDPSLQATSSQAAQVQGDEFFIRGQQDHDAETIIRSIRASHQHIRSVAFIGDAAGTTMMLGILCFLASVQCLAIATQPTVVWVVSSVACSFVIVLPLLNRILAIVYMRLPNAFDF